MIMNAPFAHAYQRVRDTEIEEAIQKALLPIFRAASINPDDAKFYILLDNQLNAFVAGGMNIAMSTGLLMFSESPETLQGVIAHELGHIKGGHIVKRVDEYKRSMIVKAAAAILGVAAAVTTGSPGAGAAILVAGVDASGKNFLAFTRSQEQAADLAGIEYLKIAKISPKGLLDLLQQFSREEKTAFDAKEMMYLLTHPLGQERLGYLREKAEEIKSLPQDQDMLIAYQHAIIKLKAFLDPPEKTLTRYLETNRNFEARYARAIAYLRLPDPIKALAETEALIALYPKNSFLYELQGKIFIEKGEIARAIENYQKALEHDVHSPLLLVQLGAAELAAEQDDYLQSAINHLKEALSVETDNTFAWYQLGVAYGKKGQLDLSYLALAEHALHSHKLKDAKKYVALSKQHMDPASHDMMRLQDIEQIIQKKK